MNEYFVYIMTNHARTLYIGVTNDLPRRVWEHQNGSVSSFTGRYRITQLVWYASFTDVNEAIAFEKKIKGWTRKRKIELIEAKNPYWFDLADIWDGPKEGKVDPSLRSG
jgi:putative endonuclease